jgi:hypothetical protein
MAEKLTAEQIRQAEDEGDEFEFPDDGHRSIEGFSELVAELRALVEAQRANAGADMLRSENFEQLLELLQKIVSRPAAGMNMDPLHDILREMQGQQIPGHIAYEFNVKRDQNGFMQTITATPVAPTTH